MDIDNEVLQHETRLLGFDFEAVAEKLSLRYNKNYTASECRFSYAKSFMAATSSHSGGVHCEHEGVEHEISDSMTFGEILDVVERRNERNEQRKVKIFSKVLAALGPAVPESVAPSGELQLIKTAMAERKRAKEMEIIRKEKAAQEQEELHWLQRERDRLKQRNMPGSIDAEGEIPQIMYENAEKKSQIHPSNTENENEEEEVGTVESNYDFDVEKIFGDENLDILLEQIEKELDAQAAAKPSPDEAVSELAEVLNFLDKSVASKTKTILQVPNPVQQQPRGTNGPDSSHTAEGILSASVTTSTNTQPSDTVVNEIDSPKRLLSRGTGTGTEEGHGPTDAASDNADDDDDDDDEDWKDARARLKSKATASPVQPIVALDSFQLTHTTGPPQATAPSATHDARAEEQLPPVEDELSAECHEEVKMTGILGSAASERRTRTLRHPRVLKS
jgi:hypothetical protein